MPKIVIPNPKVTGEIPRYMGIGYTYLVEIPRYMGVGYINLGEIPRYMGVWGYINRGEDYQRCDSIDITNPNVTSGNL